jgi:ketosteroid isomerase-like protein
MPAHDRLELARNQYEAYQSGDRRVIEELLGDDFTFFSPADVGIDRAMYFERCWRNAEQIEAYDFRRLVESGDEVIVTYECTKTHGAGSATRRSSCSQATRSARRMSTSAGISTDGARSPVTGRPCGPGWGRRVGARPAASDTRAATERP